MSSSEETKDSEPPPCGRKDRPFDFTVSDFAELVATTAFVDKTLMIRDIFSNSSRLLITAPRRFGKSTIIDMVRRFLEIEVNAAGTPKQIQSTNNYRLFKDYNLDIFNDQKFFIEHFGKYPVIHVNLEPLAEAIDFVNMLEVLKTIVQKSFNSHSYLLNVPAFTIDATYFETENTVESVLAHRFDYLSTTLYRHFRSKVCVLIDNYDSFVNSTFFKKNNGDTIKTINFIKRTIGSVLNSQCVRLVLITGVLPLTGAGFPLHKRNIRCYSFLGDHCFSKYYTLTSDELEEVMKKLITDSEDRIKTKRMIEEYYSGYKIQNHSVQMYNIWSVFQYIHSREIQSYWHSHECIEIFKPVFKNSQVRDKIEKLVLGDDELRLDTSRPFSTLDFLELNSAVDSTESEDPSVSSVVIDAFFLTLYHFGYLSVNNVCGRGFVYLKIPNEEIKYELTKVLLDSNHVYYNSLEEADDVRCVFCSVKFDENVLSDMMYNFCDSLKIWSGPVILPSYKFDTDLFFILLINPEYTHAVFHKLGRFRRDPRVILFKNKHDVAFCITVNEIVPYYRYKERKNLVSCCTTRDTLTYAAGEEHKKLTGHSNFEQVFNEYSNVHRKAVIAITYGYYKLANNICYGISIAYSFQLNEDDDSLQNYKTVERGFVKQTVT